MSHVSSSSDAPPAVDLKMVHEALSVLHDTRMRFGVRSYTMPPRETCLELQKEPREKAAAALAEAGVGPFFVMTVTYNGRPHDVVFSNLVMATLAYETVYRNPSEGGRRHVSLLRDAKAWQFDLIPDAEVSQTMREAMLQALIRGNDANEVRRLTNVVMQANLAYNAGWEVRIKTALPFDKTIVFVNKIDAEHAAAKLRALMGVLYSNPVNYSVTVEIISDRQRAAIAAGNPPEFFTHLWETEALDQLIHDWNVLHRIPPAMMNGPPTTMRAFQPSDFVDAMRIGTLQLDHPDRIAYTASFNPDQEKK
jgi:hypothetical protein